MTKKITLKEIYKKYDFLLQIFINLVVTIKESLKKVGKILVR